MFAVSKRYEFLTEFAICLRLDMSCGRDMPLRGVKEFISYRTAQAVYRGKAVFMEEKTIKELAVELTVEVNELCDSIKAKAVYAISCFVPVRQ